MTSSNRPTTPGRPGPEAIGSIVKRYRKRDRQYTYGLRVRAHGGRHWVPLGTEREGWNDVRAADRRDEIAALISRGAWRPPNTFELDPREKNPGFHEFASDWLKRYRRTVDGSTGDKAEYLLSHHLLPFLHTYRLDEIDYAVLSAYVAHKLERNEEIVSARGADVTLRDSSGRARRALSPRTINMSLDLAARILGDAVKRGFLQSNPATNRDLRLKVTQHKGNFLEADELLALIEAASAIDDPVSAHTLGRAELARRMRGDSHTWKEIAAELDVAESTAIWLAGRHRRDGRASPRRAIMATLGCAGLRNTEACGLNIGDLDFAHGVIHVRDAKTAAGIRQVHMPHGCTTSCSPTAPPGPTRSRTSPRFRRATARAETFATSTGGSSPLPWAPRTRYARSAEKLPCPARSLPTRFAARSSRSCSRPARRSRTCKDRSATRIRRRRFRSTRKSSSVGIADAMARRSMR
jgi:integrase